MSDDSSGRRRRLPSLGIEAFAFIWGLAEATVFFIVPDVLLTFLAIDNLKRAYWACVIALAGALIGGACMFAWGAGNPSGANAFLEKVPAIDAEMIETVNQNIEDTGQVALFLGSLAGRPYKIYAVNAGAKQENFWSFILVSIPARLVRFLLLTLGIGLVAHGVLKKYSPSIKRGTLALFWLSFYSWYFLAHG